ncbi:hypothetical protein HOK68_03435 [Candidatus Woesearchaeota archaeon]|nr:hypothetical protein [Candidatus Woesearchaeota archaeon]
MDFPIKRKIKGKENSIEKFTYSTKPRIKKIYDIIKTSLISENSKLNNDFKSKLKETTKHISNIEYDVIENINNNKDTLVIIKDEFAKFDNQPFEFIFILENRPPVLDTIQSNELNSLLKRNRNVDFYLTVGDTLTINPIGNDPDEDKLEYKYSGWKAEYDDEYNITIGCTNPSIWVNKKEQNSNCQVGGNVILNPEKKPIGGNKWESSDLFKSNKKSASIELGIKDIGWHEFRVTVSDGLHKDYQDIRVVVGPKPFPVVKLNNLYNDEEDLVSVESPFYFTSKDSISSGFSIDRRTWILNENKLNQKEGQVDFMLPDYVDGGELINSIIFKETQNRDQKYTKTEYEKLEKYIKNIKNENKEIQFGENELILQIGLKNSFNDIETLFKFKGEACIINDVSIAPWPFNLIEKPAITTIFNNGNEKAYSNSNSIINQEYLSPFKTDSACCNEGAVSNSYKQNSELCFNYEYETTPLYFPNDVYFAMKKNQDENTVNNKIKSKLGQNHIYDDLANDVVKLKITNKCNGERGNICSGDFEWDTRFKNLIGDTPTQISPNDDNYNLVTSCDGDTTPFTTSDNKNIFRTESNVDFITYNNKPSPVLGEIKGARCRGSIDQNGDPTNICRKYTGTTFEQIVYIHRGDIFNDLIDITSKNNICSKGEVVSGCYYKHNGVTTKFRTPSTGKTKTYAINSELTCENGWCRKPADIKTCTSGTVCTYKPDGNLNSKRRIYTGYCNDGNDFSSQKPCEFSTDNKIKNVDTSDSNNPIKTNSIIKWKYKNKEGYNQEYKYLQHCEPTINTNGKTQNNGLYEGENIKKLCDYPSKPLFNHDTGQCWNPCDNIENLNSFQSYFEQIDQNNQINFSTNTMLGSKQIPSDISSSFKTDLINNCFYTQLTPQGGRCIYRITNGNNCDTTSDILAVEGDNGDYKTINTGICKITIDGQFNCFADLKQYNYKENNDICQFNDECKSGFCKSKLDSQNSICTPKSHINYFDNTCTGVNRILSLADFETFKTKIPNPNKVNENDPDEIQSEFGKNEGHYRIPYILSKNYCFYTKKKINSVMTNKLSVENNIINWDNKQERDVYNPKQKSCISNETLFLKDKWDDGTGNIDFELLSERITDYCKNVCSWTSEYVINRYVWNNGNDNDKFNSVCGIILNSPTIDQAAINIEDNYEDNIILSGLIDSTDTKTFFRIKRKDEVVIN